MTNIIITDEQFDQLLKLRDMLDKQSADAQASGNAYMASVFTELLAIVVIRVSRVQAARHRAMIAEHRKQVKALRASNSANSQTP